MRSGFQKIRYTFHIETTDFEEKIEAYKEYIEAHCPVGDTIANTVNFVSANVVVESQVK